MKNITEIAAQNQEKAWEIIRKTNVMNIWNAIGAEIHLVGSLKMGLLMKHRDIDFHIYTSPLTLAESFRAIEKLAENEYIEKIEYTNLLKSEDACIEWHAWYRDQDNDLWQIDMIHMEKNSRFDGYFEKMAERISALLTEETKQKILQLKYQTPDTEKIMGIEYYQAVIRDGVQNYTEFEKWRKQHPLRGIQEWIP